MTADEFRRLALSLPEAAEASHMNHPDFRVGGKIFATLGPDETWGMVKLTPRDQAAAIRKAPEVFSRIKGAWGRGGATRVDLAEASASIAEEALTDAWRNIAPKRLVEEFDG
jgi:hypothetical protein